MASEFMTSLGIFKTMFDMAKGLKDVNDATIRNAAVIELQEKILAAQTQQATLVERVRELETDVARFEEWETEKQKYELERFGDGCFAYTLKEDTDSAEPPHKACANCYKERHISILQTETRDPGRWTVLVCQRCAATLWPDGGGQLTTAPKKSSNPTRWRR